MSRDCLRWHAAIRDLALDSSVPDWRDAGLSLDHKEAIIVKRCAKHTYSRLLDSATDYFDLDDFSPVRLSREFDSFDDCICAAIRPEVADRVAAWIRECYVFGTEEGANVHFWWSALFHMHERDLGDCAHFLHPGKVEDVRKAVGRYLLRNGRTPWGPRRPERVLSEWDRQILRQSRSVPHDEGDIASGIYSTQTFVRLRRLRQWLLEHLNQVEREQLFKLANCVLRGKAANVMSFLPGDRPTS